MHTRMVDLNSQQTLTLRATALAALEHSRRSFDLPSVDMWAGELLQLDPLDREAALALAESAAMRGDTAGALARLNGHIGASAAASDRALNAARMRSVTGRPQLSVVR